MAVLVAGGVLIGFFGRYWSFFYDEWGTILYRRSGGASAFLAPHNGHLQATVIAVYRLLFATVGLHSYRPYQAAVIVAHLVAVGLIYLYARSRLGAWTAVVAIIPVLLLAYAWQVLFWGINLGFVFPMIALMLILLVRRPWVSGVALAFALASSGLGLAVAAAALVLCVRERAGVRFLVAWVLPVAAYLLWWVIYRPTVLPPAALRRIPGASRTGDVGYISFPSDNVKRAPDYVAHSAKAAAAALMSTGRAAGWGPLVALAAVVCVGALMQRHISAELLALVVGAGAFWVETALARAQLASPESADASRYLYPGAIFLLLILVESLDNLPLSWWLVLLLAAAILASTVHDVQIFRRFEHGTQIAFAREAAALRAAHCGPPLPVDHAIAPSQAPGLTYGPFQAAVRALGAPPGVSC